MIALDCKTPGQGSCRNVQCKLVCAGAEIGMAEELVDASSTINVFWMKYIVDHIIIL